jgi:hypothetical protein
VDHLGGPSFAENSPRLPGNTAKPTVTRHALSPEILNPAGIPAALQALGRRGHGSWRGRARRCLFNRRCYGLGRPRLVLGAAPMAEDRLKGRTADCTAKSFSAPPLLAVRGWECYISLETHGFKPGLFAPAKIR